MLGLVKHTTEGEALAHDWSKGDPRYTYAETQTKLDHWRAGPPRCETFRKYAGNQCAGCALTCKSPIQLGHPDDASALKLAIEDLNFRYFVAKIGGGAFVFDEQDKNILAGAMAFTAFRQFHAGKRIGQKEIATEWLKSRTRRTYQSLTFEPSGICPDRSFNTWRGLAVIPQAGKKRKILEHIHDVWCGGSLDQFDYVKKWLALLVQKPWIKPEVALVLRSKEGTGKSIITNMLLKIFDPHGFTTAQKEQVMGRFSGHLFDKVLIVLEEAFFAGDPSAVAEAKVLVTNPMMGYEAKGKDAITAPNYAHVIILTNSAWAVPAGEDTRRWMVLDVSAEHVDDHAYFAALAACMENSGTEAFLDYLLGIDLTGWNPRALPESKALVSQQVETMRHSNPAAAWLLTALAEGEFPINGGAVPWDLEITSSDLQESYSVSTAGARHAPPFNVAMMKVRTYLPSGALPRVRKANGADRFVSYKLPDLSTARAHFKTVTGIDPCAI